MTSGTSEAYSHVFRLLCEPGDEVLVPAPSYPLLEFLAELADVRLATYPLLYDHGWHVDLPGLRAAITARSRAVVVVHPNNPTGSFVKPREAEALAEICRDAQMAIVADEVFLDFADGIEAAASFAGGSGALTFTLSGLSKISRAAADEARLDSREWARDRDARGGRAARSHRGHISFPQHTRAACGRKISGDARRNAIANQRTRRRQSGVSRREAARLARCDAARTGRRLVRRAARAGIGLG